MRLSIKWLQYIRYWSILDMHCNNPEKVFTLNRYCFFIMFVYIHLTHMMTICTRFDICSSRKVKSVKGYPNRVGSFRLKAILQLFIYKALYDQSYLGSKTTMTTGEWSCLIWFAWDPLTCSERRGGSEKFKMKIYVSSGIGTHASPRHD